MDGEHKERQLGCHKVATADRANQPVMAGTGNDVLMDNGRNQPGNRKIDDGWKKSSDREQQVRFVEVPQLHPCGKVGKLCGSGQCYERPELNAVSLQDVKERPHALAPRAERNNEVT